MLQYLPTVPVNNGSRAAIVGITEINQTSRTAGVVIDAKDRFGNKVRKFKTVPFKLSKLRAYYTLCLRNAALCLASTAISSALLYYGYNVINGIAYSNAGSNYPDCVTAPMPDNIDGHIRSAYGPIPCQTGPTFKGDYHVYSETALSTGTFNYESGLWIFKQGQSTTYHANLKVYVFGKQPISEPTEISDEALSNALLSNPSNLQSKHTGCYD